jgi:hypothetical protein
VVVGSDIECGCLPEEAGEFAGVGDRDDPGGLASLFA